MSWIFRTDRTWCASSGWCAHTTCPRHLDNLHPALPAHVMLSQSDFQGTALCPLTTTPHGMEAA